MVSKNQSKFIKSLKIKKYRNLERCFLVEGRKNVIELIHSDYEVRWIIATNEFLKSNEMIFKKISPDKIFEATPSVLSDIGTFTSNQDCLAVAVMKDDELIIKPSNTLFVLDGVGDPGNLGTIIRTLDWFGFDQVVCSHDTADFYNPKVINATMGSFMRVKVHYTDLPEFLQTHNDREILGADMSGMDPAQFASNSKPKIVVMGSESHGISQPVVDLLTQKISIPGKGQAESLNVAMATGILAYLFGQ